MKTFYLLLICIALNYESVRGGFAKDLFGNIKQGTDKVREDIRNVLHINKNQEEKDAASESNNTTEGKESTTTVAPTSSTTVGAETTTTGSDVSNTTVTPSTNGTADGKDGRENFTAGCLAGYKPDDNGICRKIF